MSAPEGSRPANDEAPFASLYEGTLDCVHCGLCLPDCPTYRISGRETSSPRGRIYLMRAVGEGRIPMDEVVAEEMSLCLGCRACESACPSGVEYGHLLEEARAEIVRAGARTGLTASLERFGLRAIVPHRLRLRLLVSLAGLAQRLGLDRLIPPARLLPRVPPRSERRRLPARIAAQGEKRGRVAFFEGCVMPELFGPINHATARVLARNGFEVVVPSGQGCCGALHAHAGDAELAESLHARNETAFSAWGAGAVVLNSAGCGAHLRTRLDGVRDVCELLAEEGLRRPSGRLELRVCYDDPCHLLHGQGVKDAPRELLRSIPGVELVDHDDPGACCGAAGTYNLVQPAMSRAVLERKMESLRAADPDVIATGNPGCLMQLQAGVREWGLRAEVLHPVELLERAYRSDPRDPTRTAQSS
ncbi:MAG: (Fe-S)-binding protein [Myxococcota bacterium]|nr:(Fe-S)-binding protein [Myxococcota bacterium]